MGLYKTIQEACEKAGVSVNKLENDTGITRGSIYKWDNHRPSFDKVCLVADYLKIPVDDLREECEGDS